jgi:NADH-quinone oxidoreductase subunit H
MADLFNTIGGWLTTLLERIGASQLIIDLVMATIGAVVIIFFLLTMALVIIWIERKMVGRIQDRIGPNRVGPWGIFQNIADVVKLMTKEIIIPTGADLIPFMLAPIISVASVFLIWAALPFTRTTVGTNVNIGALYIVAVSSLSIMAILMAGWSSNNKYALLGAFRGVAMLVSYEVPIVLTLLVPVFLTGSMRVNDIVEGQSIWYVFSMPLAALIFYIGNHAEAARSPFDMLEAESEIVAGFHIEYSGMAFAMFYLAEFLHAFTISALAATLFFGGWRGPGAAEIPILGVFYFFLKTFVIYFVNVWARGTLPRLRIDQMMSFCWKFLVPISLLLLIVAFMADKIAAIIIPGYQMTGTFVEVLPRAAVLLSVNLVIGGLVIAYITRQGRRERERYEMIETAPIERQPVESAPPAAQQAN